MKHTRATAAESFFFFLYSRSLFPVAGGMALFCGATYTNWKNLATPIGAGWEAQFPGFK